jgi:DNA polymerase I-like protein with 3'-5' exonuclease and polymerase domains
MSHKDVLEFINNWFKAFPDSQRYAKEIEDHLNIYNQAIPRPGSTPTHVGTWRMRHGRHLTFREYDEGTSIHGQNYNWRRPTLKNYPIQALASDAVKYAISRVVRKLMTTKELNAVKLVNTVHDNGVFYIPAQGISGFINTISDIMSGVPDYLDAHGYSTKGLPFKVEASSGSNWYNCA